MIGEGLRPGVSIAAVALAHKLNASMPRNWVIEAEHKGVPPRTAARCASGTFFAPHTAWRSRSIIFASTALQAATHGRGRHARLSLRTPWTFSENCTGAAGTTRSAGFVGDFILVVPFFAC